MKIKNLSELTILNGIKVKIEGTIYCLNHAWICGDSKVGMFLMTPEQYKNGNGRLFPFFMSMLEFENLEIVEEICDGG